MEIQSSDNAKFKHWLSLTTSKGLKRSEECLVSGEKIVAEIVQNFSERVICTLKTAKMKATIGGKEFTLAPELFHQLDVLGTHRPLLVAQQPDIVETDWKKQAHRVLSPIGDPSNLGGLIRTASAFAVDELVLLPQCCHPFLPKTTKAAAGQNFFLPLSKAEQIPELPVTALDMSGESLLNYKWPQRLHLYLGEEGQGVDSQLKAERLHIPISPDCESLNVGVAAGIALFDWHKKTEPHRSQS